MENINQEKREKFMEIAEKRVNNIIHDIEILKPMAGSTNYDYTKEDIDNMFEAILQCVTDCKSEYIRKIEGKQTKERKSFSFVNSNIESNSNDTEICQDNNEKINIISGKTIVQFGKNKFIKII